MSFDFCLVWFGWDLLGESLELGIESFFGFELFGNEIFDWLVVIFVYNLEFLFWIRLKFFEDRFW